ncbi:MAG TPA: response regulator transcription factor [Mycobacterium sp.]|nr:response regulator transcription factor [Mycobacterium sp.]
MTAQPVSLPSGTPAESAPTRVLLIEDDAQIRRALTLALADEGYAVESVSRGEEALHRMETAGAPDVVLLDLMLPGMDGFTVCQRIRALGDVPIIIVTARGDRKDVIAGLEAGADDYVTKPLDAGELGARIRALRRRVRSDGGIEPVLRIGEVEVDLSRGTAGIGSASLHLTKTEFRLLTELLHADGRVVTREELLARVWQYDYFGDTRLLDVHIRRLRRKVEPDPNQPQHILTVRGVGYRAVR